VSKLTWDNFVDAYPRSHLVLRGCMGGSGSVQRGRHSSLYSREWLRCWSRMGNWAITNANASEIYTAYENEADAALLCTLVRAKRGSITLVDVGCSRPVRSMSISARSADGTSRCPG
jgi:hypothetical protein